MSLKNISLSIFYLSISYHVYASEYTFDAKLLGENGQNVDISLLNEGGQLPGTYTVDVVLNGEFIESRDFDFTLQDKVLRPCLITDDLNNYGVITSGFKPVAALSMPQCIDISIIPYASMEFDFNNLQLKINIPQVFMNNKTSDLLKISQWDDGIPVARLNYRVSTTKSLNNISNGNDNNTYVQVYPGFNIGSWRVRNQTNWSNNESGSRLQPVYTYAENGIKSLKSKISLGQRTTPGEIFDSVPFTGAMAGTDESMIPNAQRSFTPVVRGIARTQAKIEVMQNGYVIYTTTVAPGPFELADLSTTTASDGELNVTIKESDGHNQVFNVPYQTPAISVRKSYFAYNIVSGRYRSSDPTVDKAKFAQGTLIYGLPWNLTFYTGMQASKHYQSTSLGLGASLGIFGSVSLDTIISGSKKKYQDIERGSAWRARYTKSLTSTNTIFSLSTTRYTNGKYNSLSEVMDTWNHSNTGELAPQISGRRRKTTSLLQLSQRIDKYGFLNINTSRTDYINRDSHDNNLGVSYGFDISGVSFSLGWSLSTQYDEYGNKKTDRLGSFSVNLPFEILEGKKTQLTYQSTLPSSGENTHEIGLNGYAYDDQLYWDIRERIERSGRSNAMQVSWSGTYGKAGASYSYTPAMTRLGVDSVGGIILHREGLTFSQYLGDTVALVEASGATDVKVTGSPGVKTDFRGYTAVPYLSPYQENTISLDPSSISDGIEITQTDLKVVPTSGAVVSAKFMSRIGEKALVTVMQENGEPIPFGSVVKADDSGNGVSGDGGQVYLTGLLSKGRLVARWKNGKQCAGEYYLPKVRAKSGLHTISVQCSNTSHIHN